MNDFVKEVISLSLVGKCIAAVVGILFIYATFRVLEQSLPKHFGRADARYKVRKFVVYCGYLAILLFLAILFEDRLGRLSFALGVAGAGSRTCWRASPVLSRSVFQNCIAWATGFRSAILAVT
jgi:hypothetical protein